MALCPTAALLERRWPLVDSKSTLMTACMMEPWDTGTNPIFKKFYMLNNTNKSFAWFYFSAWRRVSGSWQMEVGVWTISLKATFMVSGPDMTMWAGAMLAFPAALWKWHSSLTASETLRQWRWVWNSRSVPIRFHPNTYSYIEIAILNSNISYGLQFFLACWMISFKNSCQSRSV